MKHDAHGNVIRDFGPASDGSPRMYPARKEGGYWWVFRDHADGSGKRWDCTGCHSLAELREQMA